MLRIHISRALVTFPFLSCRLECTHGSQKRTKRKVNTHTQRQNKAAAKSHNKQMSEFHSTPTVLMFSFTTVIYHILNMKQHPAAFNVCECVSWLAHNDDEPGYWVKMHIKFTGQIIKCCIYLFCVPRFGKREPEKKGSCLSLSRIK